MDMWNDLRVVASYSTDRRASSSTAVTAMATLDTRSAVVAGCSDGTIRMIDHGSLSDSLPELWLGAVSDTDFLNRSGLLEFQQQFQSNDDSSELAFQNISVALVKNVCESKF